MFKDILTKITAEGVAIVGLITIAILALLYFAEPETVVVAIASGLIGYIKGATNNGTNT